MILEFKDLCFSYNNNDTLFEGVSFMLKEGEVLNILGANGIGKTTFAKCLLNVLSTYKGAITFDGYSSKKLSIKERAKYIGYIGLESALPSRLTVFEYVLLGTASALGIFSTPSARNEEKVLDALDNMKCSYLKDKKMSQLSQGELQLVSVARILAQNPSIVIFDEPTASLDLGNQQRLLQLVKKLQEDNHIIINITHNPNHAFVLGGYSLMLMHEKHLVGAIDDVMTEENLSELYGTKIKIIEDNTVGKIATSY